MEKWNFNFPLFSQLTEVMDLTGTEIARRCGLRQQVLSRYTTNERVVTIQVLLKLCNAIRMPIHFFVSENGNYIIPNRESATIPVDNWKPVSWNFANVEKTFGYKDGQIPWRDVAEVMDVTPMKPIGRFALKRRFKVTDFFTACNAFDLSPFLFLNDPNRPDDNAEGKAESGKTKGKAKKSKPSPPPSYDELSRQVSDLRRGIADLTQKFQDLLQAHEALVRRVQVNIQNVQNSNIQNVNNSHISNVGNMAAEERHDKD